MQKIAGYILPKNIVLHDRFSEEFIDMLESCPEKKRLLGLFVARLKAISESLPHVITKAKWFEHLKENNNLYSLHLVSSSRNIRILLSYDGDNRIVLHSFQEVAGKGVSEYGKHIEVAKDRREEMSKRAKRRKGVHNG